MATKQIEGIVAVTDQMSGSAGAVTYWNLNGGVDASSLKQAWATAGFDEKLLPETPTPRSALGRAVAEMKEHRRLVRPLPGGIGWAIVDETTTGADNEDLSWNVAARVRVDGVGRAVVEPSYHQLRPEIDAAYTRHLDSLSTGDVGGWLAHTARRLGAVALRATGGVYFIPAFAIDTWRAMVAALQTCSSHVVFEIPAMTCSSAVAAVLDAISAEAKADAEEMQADLDAGTLGTRALKGRAQRASDLLDKVEKYEATLGTKLDELRERISALRSNITVAVLQAESEEDE
jgi:hypothetical protein